MIPRDSEIKLLPFFLAEHYSTDPCVFLDKPMSVILDLVSGTVALREKKAKHGRSA